MTDIIQPESELIINELKIILSDIQYRINNLINHIHSQETKPVKFLLDSADSSPDIQTNCSLGETAPDFKSDKLHYRHT